jgi:ZIP family zinc transporter
MFTERIFTAFLLTLAAGLSTGIGSVVALFAKKTNTKFLSVSLGFSAGVMTYVSMAEIFAGAQASLAAELGGRDGLSVAAAAFFGGMIAIALINKAIPLRGGAGVKEVAASFDKGNSERGIHQKKRDTDKSERDINKTECKSKCNTDKNECNTDKSEYGINKIECEINKTECKIESNTDKSEHGIDKKKRNTDKSERGIHKKKRGVKLNGGETSGIFAPNLMRSGLLTALALGIHNFPEGLVTFMSALQDIKIAVPIVVAIAIHNIPEGIAVSVPVYYATGNKKKAFGYSFLSGITEPLGALIGYFILMPFLNAAVMGIVCAAVAGIMVFISIDELLPAAREYGEHNLSIYGFVGGMAVMAFSLILFA